MKTKTLSALTAAVALTIGLAAAPVPASAQGTAASQGATTTRGVAPAAVPAASEAWRDCVETSWLYIPLSLVLWYFPMEVYNGCHYTVKLRSTFSFGNDSACRDFPPGFRSALWSPFPYATPGEAVHC